jgi:hypothetical protein
VHQTASAAHLTAFVPQLGLCLLMFNQMQKAFKIEARRGTRGLSLLRCMAYLAHALLVVFIGIIDSQ